MIDINFTPILMFLGLLIAILIGIPIAFASGMVGLITAFFLWGPASLRVILTALSGTMGNWILLAVPLFTFMAMVLDKTGVVEDLYDTFYIWSGSLRGGLGVATVIVGTVMGAMTGVAAGTVTALGTIALPQMFKYKYDKGLAMGPILAGGTLGQLVPPSTVMIMYGAMAGVSVGGLFAGGVSSGLFLSAIYCFYILVRSYLNPSLCPALPVEERASMTKKLLATRKILLPALLIIAVLGAIFSGLATPTEASAVGSSGALLCALVKRRLRWELIFHAMMETLRVTCMVAWITIGALCFGNVFTAIGGNVFVRELAESVPFGSYGTLIFIMATLYFLGMFLDTIAIVVITAPIVAPLMSGLGFNPLWFGILFMMNMQSAYLTPPFGYSLFYLKGVTPPDISIADVYRSAFPFVGLQIIGLAGIILFPIIGMWLPTLLGYY